MMSPLADRMRPESLDDFVGQEHLVGNNKALRKIIESGNIPNMIFYGSSGIGKTTLAQIIAKQTDRKLHKLNGTTASTSDIKDVVAEINTFTAPNGVLLYLDEIQYFNKKQQQTLLEHMENGKITLIASTTENPYFYVYNAILSRSTIFEFRPLTPKEVRPAILRGFAYIEKEENAKINVSPQTIEYISSSCGGDVRKALNTVELCFLAADYKDGEFVVLEENARELSQKSVIRYDREGDEHYDILSAFQKSMRGSDPDASIHYLARLLEAGDLASICRRLMVCASEDVGMAYPMIIPIVKACIDAAMQVGMPEARIPLADAVILVATSPKSNSAYLALDKATADIREGKTGEIPAYLQSSSYSAAHKLGKGIGYQYSHNFENHWVSQQYLPEILQGTKYYEFGENKTEQTAKNYWEKIKQYKL